MKDNTPEAGWRQRQRQELNQLIYTTSLELFRSEGFARTTVQQITSAAGVAKGTFFNHFASKDQVLQEWYRRITLSALDEASQRTFTSGRDAILALTGRLAEAVSADPVLWDAKVSAASSTVLRNEENELDQAVLSFCRGAIASDIRGHSVEGVDPVFLAGLVLTLITGAAHSWSISGRRGDLVQLVHDQVSYILATIQEHQESIYAK